MKSLRVCSLVWLTLSITLLSGHAIAAPSVSAKEDKWNGIENIGPDELRQYIDEHGSMVIDNATAPNFSPICATQKSLTANNSSELAKLTNEAIFVGQDRITRWSQGSSIWWTPNIMGYPSIKDAMYAAEHLDKATKEWNTKGIGVRFKHTAAASKSDLVLSYGGELKDEDKKTIAIAFFPNEHKMNELKVFKRAFDPDTKPIMWKYLLHELGHVLGLRHEFAMDPGESFEGGAIRIGTRNALSVMNYYQPGGPEIQESDVVDTKRFYEYPEGITLDSHELKIFNPQH